MKKFPRIINVSLILLTVLFVNGASLGEAIIYGQHDSSLIDSMSGEDEMRYIGKMHEAYEGHWLMSNPYLKEHRDESFSPSGFLEWIPAVMLRMTHGDMGFVLLVTDILFSALTIILTWLWLKRIIPSDLIIWCCMCLLFSTDFGGSLDGLLRDTVPKFVQPLMSLYLLLLTLPSRGTIRSTMIRGALIGCMFYTYPYHWSLCLMTEAVFLIYQMFTVTGGWRPVARRFSFLLKHGAAVCLPFVIIAAPIAIAMKHMLSKPEFKDFYDRYHIVYTHLPAAPSLQLIVLCALLVITGYIVWRKKKDHMPVLNQMEELLPLLLPLGGMMVLLNANVITGKDPELLGHGGRVIMSVVTVAYAAIIARILPTKIITIVGSIGLAMMILIAGNKTATNWSALHTTIINWNVSPERSVLEWMDRHLPPERIVAAPRAISEKIPVLTSHYVFFGAGAHFFFVTLDELTDRYLGWVGLYPNAKELTDTATVIIFGNHPGAQWSKERTEHKLLGEPFTKTMADYIGRQDLRRRIDEEHAHPDDAKTAERVMKYNTDVIVLDANSHWIPSLMNGFTKATVIGPYTVYVRNDVTVKS